MGRRARLRLGVAPVASCLAGLGLAGAASAAPVALITEFSGGLKTGNSPMYVAPGTDGNVWLSDGAAAAGPSPARTACATSCDGSTGAGSSPAPSGPPGPGARSPPWRGRCACVSRVVP